MQKHTQIYLQGMGYDATSFVPCEVCGGVGVDIHHIEARGMGGNKKADVIDNLMCLCRQHHIEFGDKKQYKEYLKNVHYEYMERHNRL